MNNQVHFKTGSAISNYNTNSQSAGDLLIVPSVQNNNVATLYYFDGTYIRNVAPYEYGTTLPTTNNYEGKLFFKII